MTLDEIAKWQKSTFGPPTQAAYTAARANEEMSELVMATADGSNYREIMKEAADVVIVLTALGEFTGFSLQKAIDAKMEINKTRRWKSDGFGHGNHIKE